MDNKLQHSLNFLLDASKKDFPSFSLTEHWIINDGTPTFHAIAPRLLHQYLITVKIMYPSVLPEIVTKIWDNIGKCFEGALLPNLLILEEITPDTPKESLELLEYPAMHYNSTQILFRGVDIVDVERNFAPLLGQAHDILTYLITPFFNPDKSYSEPGSSYPVSKAVTQPTQALIALLEEPKQHQVALKALCIRRDGQSCAITNTPFGVEDIRTCSQTLFSPMSSMNEAEVGDPPQTYDAPTLCQIIPRAATSDNLLAFTEHIAVFAGPAVAEKVSSMTNTTKNAFNSVQRVHEAYDTLRWSIYYQVRDKTYRYFPFVEPDVAGMPALLTHARIRFGNGTEGGLEAGPDPDLVNLQYAVTMLARFSGAARYLEDLYDRQYLVDAIPAELPEQWFARALDLKLTWIAIKTSECL